MKWNETLIARVIGQEVFHRRCLLLVDNCIWTGHECDVLGVTHDLRIIDVEIKISRADLKADAKKDKWWSRQGYGWQHRDLPPVARLHPPKVWKHYYALPRDLWIDDLYKALPSEKSGVLLVWEVRGRVHVTVKRRAVPAKDATRLTAVQAVDIARLANLRMWDAYASAESSRAEAIAWRREADGWRETALGIAQ